MIPWFYTVTRWVVWLWFYGICRTKDDGAQGMPETGPVVLAVNHASFWDPMLIAALFRRPVGFMARDSLFRIPLFGRYITALNAFPVDRKAPQSAMRVCGERLDRGEVVLVFPEGTRTADGHLGEIKGGAALLAAQHQAPVLPVYLWGTYQSWPRSRRLPRWHRCHCYVGTPIPPEENGAKLTRRELARRTEAALRELEARAFAEHGPPPDPNPGQPA